MNHPRKRAENGKTPRKKPKLRTNISLSEDLMAAATFLGEKLFGNRTAYVEYALLNDLKAQGLTVDKIIELAENERRADAEQSEK